MEKLLVVEDTAVLLSMATQLLSLNGYEVSGASDGDQGWRMASQR